MKNKTFLISSACIAALICAPLAASAAETKASPAAAASSASPAAKASASPAASPAKQSTRPIPFHGMVSTVDQTAKTFTIAGKEASRVFKVTDKTAVTKAGQPATIGDITANVEVSGSYWKESMEAKTVKVGPASEKKAGEKGKEAKASPSPSASPKATAKPKPY